MANNRSISVALILMMILAAPIDGAEADWGKLTALRAGEEIRVETAAGRQRGAFVSVSETDLILTPSGAPQMIVPRSDVTRVSVRSRSRRLRNTLIGTAVGTAAGVVLYGVLGELLRNEGAEDTAALLAIPMAIGAGIGAVVPTGGFRKIYEVRRR